MSDNLILTLKNTVTDAGVIKTQKSKGVSSLRYQVTGAGPTNRIVVEGSLEPDPNTATFYQIDNSELVGDGTLLLETATFEWIRIKCTVYGGTQFDIYHLYGNLGQVTHGSITANVPQPLTTIEDEHALQIEYVAGTCNPLYVGEAAPGSVTSAAVWRIMKLTHDASGNVTVIEWADGDENFDNIYDNRVGISYS